MDTNKQHQDSSNPNQGKPQQQKWDKDNQQQQGGMDQQKKNQQGERDMQDQERKRA